MYRKYIQELSATSASPDPDFPDTNLIVGEAQLKAARAGAAQSLHVATTMPASPSSAGLSDTRTAHTTVSDPPPILPGGDSDTDSDSNSVSLSVRSESALASVGRAAGGVTRSASTVCRGPGTLKDSRRHSEIFHLQEIFSRSNTPEFRRPPASHTYPSLRASPPRVSEDDRFPTLSHEEVIVARPVAEASRDRSPLYPAPRGDLLLNHRSAPTPHRGLIKVLSNSSANDETEWTGPQLTRGPEGGPLSSNHLNNTFNRNNDPWLRSAPRPPASPPQSGARCHSAAGPFLYSMFCCRAFSSGR